MIGSRLRELRTEKDLTQAELGKVLGVGKTTISQYESETRKPDGDMLCRISNFFNISADYLLGLSNIRTISPNVAETPAHYTPEVQAAHRIDDPTDELPEEARKTIEEFKAFVLERHKKTP